MKTVLILVNQYFYDSHIQKECRSLARDGWRVEILSFGEKEEEQLDRAHKSCNWENEGGKFWKNIVK